MHEHQDRQVWCCDCCHDTHFSLLHHMFCEQWKLNNFYLTCRTQITPVIASRFVIVQSFVGHSWTLKDLVQNFSSPFDIRRQFFSSKFLVKTAPNTHLPHQRSLENHKCAEYAKWTKRRNVRAHENFCNCNSQNTQHGLNVLMHSNIMITAILQSFTTRPQHCKHGSRWWSWPLHPPTQNAICSRRQWW